MSFVFLRLIVVSRRHIQYSCSRKCAINSFIHRVDLNPLPFDEMKIEMSHNKDAIHLLILIFVEMNVECFQNRLSVLGGLFVARVLVLILFSTIQLPASPFNTVCLHSLCRVHIGICRRRMRKTFLQWMGIENVAENFLFVVGPFNNA